MKKRRKALSLALAAAILLILLPLSSSLTVQAEEPVTYSLKFFSDRGWRCQPYAEFKDGEGDADLNYLSLYLKDGDSVVIYKGDDNSKALDLGTVKLNNLTIHQNVTAVVKAGSVKDCYILAGAVCAVDNDVTNAYIYDPATCNFNGNVLDMTFYVPDSGPSLSSNLACLGTIGHLYVYSEATGTVKSNLYNVKTGGMILQSGNFCIPSDKYSTTPTEEYTKAMEGASTPVAPATPAPATPAPAEPTPGPAPGDEYDKVPKTGDSAAYLWLFLASGAFGIGSFALRKKAD